MVLAHILLQSVLGAHKTAVLIIDVHLAVETEE